MRQMEGISIWLCLMSLLLRGVETTINDHDMLIVEEISVPQYCAKSVSPGDHAMIKYSVVHAETGDDIYTLPTDQSYHIEVGDKNVVEGLNEGLLGACEGSVRRITVPPSVGYMGLTKVPPMTNVGELDDGTTVLDFYITIENVTKVEDFAIFTALDQKNYSVVLDMIEAKQGIHAVNEWGSSPLMLAVNSGLEVVVATILNSRTRLDVNARTPSGYNALIYAAAKRNLSIVRALLQKGADPNQVVTSGPSAGWSPLHFAVNFGQLKNAQVLLEYDADPTLAAKDGTRPLDLLRNLEARDTGVFTRLLVDASRRWIAAHSATDEL